VKLVNNEFKLLNIVVDISFKLSIDNVELVDKLLRLVVYAYNGAPISNSIIDVVVP
jgi:hypothetical protein